MNVDLLREYQELYGPPVAVKRRELNGLPCVLAAQQIRFRLDEKGASLESEAGGSFFGGIRAFNFDPPFLILLMRKDAAKPYFALWVGNEQLLEKEEVQLEPPSSAPADLFGAAVQEVRVAAGA